MPYKDYTVSREYSNRKNKEWYALHKEHKVEKTAQRRQQLREWLLTQKSNFRCKCGEDHIATLQFHHRDPKVKDRTISSAVHAGWSIERIKIEMAKCDILCGNCHAKLHWQEKMVDVVQKKNHSL